MWRKAMLYLGLGPDEEYDDYDAGYEDETAPSGERAGQRARVPAGSAGAAYPDESSAIGAVRPIGPLA